MWLSQTVNTTLSGTFPASFPERGNNFFPLTFNSNINSLLVDNFKDMNVSGVTGNVTAIGGNLGVWIANTYVQDGSYFHAYCSPNPCGITLSNYLPSNCFKHQMTPITHANYGNNGSDSTTKLSNFAPTVEFLGELNIYPNPVISSCTFDFSFEISNTCTLIISDIYGREVFRPVDNKRFKDGHYTISFDLSKLQSGIYLCTLNNGNHILTKKLLKQ
ncbi:MAG: T9SS type A sorting domain-containing protein [Bacteroidia bacterium]